MASDATAADASAEVMGAVDASSHCPEFVIADISRDDAWLSVDLDDAPSLVNWR
jgi:hypothetical protein